MATLLFTFFFFVLMVGAMAVGILAGRKPIQGSCGGISAFTQEDCPICGGNPAKCDAAPDQNAPSSPDDLAVDAMRPRRNT